MREDTKFACLTAYDATTARWLQRAGVPVLLVGDTAGEVILGYSNTIHTPLDFLVTITAAVKRGAPSTFVMADMPFLSYQADEAEGIRNAGRFMTEGLADAVKIEVDGSFADLVGRMSRAGIPVVAHIGARPQQSMLKGGYFSVGKTAETARRIINDARLLEEAGAVMLLLEAIPEAVSRIIVERAGVPVIGCGAGVSCNGQIVVLQDLLGLTDWQPGFAPPLCQMGTTLMESATNWIDRVERGDLPPLPYEMDMDELRKLELD